jgi:hypothetical protein
MSRLNQGVAVPAGGPMFWEGMPMTAEVQLTKWVVFERPLLAQSGGVGVRLDLLALSGPSLLADDGLDRLT